MVKNMSLVSFPAPRYPDKVSYRIVFIMQLVWKQLNDASLMTYMCFISGTNKF